MKIAERAQAVDLRRQGFSINHIVQTIGVAKSSVSIWVRDIKVEEDRLLRINGNRCRSVNEWARIGRLNTGNAVRSELSIKRTGLCHKRQSPRICS